MGDAAEQTRRVPFKLLAPATTASLSMPDVDDALKLDMSIQILDRAPTDNRGHQEIPTRELLEVFSESRVQARRSDWPLSVPVCDLRRRTKKPAPRFCLLSFVAESFKVAPPGLAYEQQTRPPSEWRLLVMRFAVLHVVQIFLAVVQGVAF
jgi:hypothetical protein